jgi:FMN phosphatase YigB (HAD superfamily)
VAGPRRALLFDFGGTLDHPHHWLDRFVRHYRDAGMELSRAEMDIAYSHATRTAYEAGDAVHHHNLRELVHFLVSHQLEHLHRHGPDRIRDELAGTGRHRLAERVAGGFAHESTKGLARSRELLAELAKDFKLGVVSNFYGNLHVVLVEAGIRELLQVAIDSKHLRVFKPDERIFAAALKVLDMPHHRVAMVGDSLHKDCAPARKLGMRTVWLRAGHSGSGHPSPKALESVDHVIVSLEELKELQWWAG